MAARCGQVGYILLGFSQVFFKGFFPEYSSFLGFFKVSFGFLRFFKGKGGGQLAANGRHRRSCLCHTPYAGTHSSADSSDACFALQ